ncbi:MAG: ATP-binding protein, partial [Chlamydiota bacterium]
MKEYTTRKFIYQMAIWLSLFILPLILFFSISQYHLILPPAFDSQRHIFTEIWSSIISLLSGTVIFIHFFATGKNFFLFISLGYILQGAKDLIHGLLASFHGTFPLHMQQFIPFSGVTGRFFLIGFIFLALYYRKTSTPNEKKSYRAILWSSIGFLLAALTVLILSESHLPTITFPGQYISRPLDLTAGLLFLILLFFFIRLYLKSSDHTPFMHSMILSLIMSIDAQMFMMHSQALYDSYYFFGHFLKIFSYIFPILGITIGTFSMFTIAEEQKVQLGKAVKIEKELLKKYSELEFEKLKAKELKKNIDLKNEFTLVVSHELRTPLTAMKEGLSLVLDGLAGEIKPKQKELLLMVQQNIHRLTRLINDVLDYQMLSTQKVEYFMKNQEINDAIMIVVKTMEPLIQSKHLKLLLHLGKHLPKIEFDLDRIVQVLTNLLDNAIKYTDVGHISITTKQDNHHILISIQDTGCGIHPEDQENIFESFYQAFHNRQRKKGSTGLGLPISKKIIHHHKG